MRVGSGATFQKPDRLSDKIADYLASQVQTGELAPGAHLVQTKLANEFGVSRVAIRDALKHLERRGLVVDVPRKGMIVRQITEKTIHDLVAIWRTVDTLVLQVTCATIGNEDTSRLSAIVDAQQQALETGDMDTVIEKDWEFHLMLYDLCDNEVLQDVVHHLWPRTRQARGWAWVGSPPLEDGWGTRSVARHRAIVDTLEAHDPKKARRVIDEIMKEVEQELITGLRLTGRQKAEGR